MAQPLYFLPGLTRAVLLPGGKFTRSILRERGLGEIFDDLRGTDDCSVNELAGRGPGNKSGVILCYQRPDGGLPRRIGYYPDEQNWQAVNDGLWIGVDTDDPPRPEDLERRKQHAGYTIELADGNRWRVPVIRRPDGSTELPTDLYWDAGGKIVEPLKARYQSYWDETAEVAEWFFGEKGFDSPTFDKSKALDLAVRALSLNYRFGRNEQNLTRVVDKDNFLSLLAITVDVPKVTAVVDATEKKSELLSTESITPGSMEGSPATDLAGAT